jgi:enterobactin synthetase component D
MKFPDLVFELWSFTASETFRIDDAGALSLKEIKLVDADLAHLTAQDPKRKMEYQRGRALARIALEQLDSKLSDVELPPRPEGGPLWPAGTCGSISHAKSSSKAVFAIAAAKTTKLVGLGVDIEFIDRQVKPKLIERITTPSERERLPGLNPLLVLSIKESVFKALHPITNVFFGFQDAELLEVGAGEFKIRLIKDLSQRFCRGVELTGATFSIAGIQVALTTVKPPSKT